MRRLIAAHLLVSSLLLVGCDQETASRSDTDTDEAKADTAEDDSGADDSGTDDSEDDDTGDDDDTSGGDTGDEHTDTDDDTGPQASCYGPQLCEPIDNRVEGCAANGCQVGKCFSTNILGAIFCSDRTPQQCDGVCQMTNGRCQDNPSAIRYCGGYTDRDACLDDDACAWETHACRGTPSNPTDYCEVQGQLGIPEGSCRDIGCVWGVKP